ncbi:hypothetical protein CHELA20_51051 [Hyphomicrobiales bacterium]|nr:hypothetical protein CHELA20_51051 [Hyphomicrobiales bacterium]CAH1674400.1 hypothetical protein CHELA41_23959 [Hyphomicrobiales bacterium]
MRAQLCSPRRRCPRKHYPRCRLLSACRTWRLWRKVADGAAGAALGAVVATLPIKVRFQVVAGPARRAAWLLAGMVARPVSGAGHGAIAAIRPTMGLCRAVAGNKHLEIVIGVARMPARPAFIFPLGIS